MAAHRGRLIGFLENEPFSPSVSPLLYKNQASGKIIDINFIFA
jgi:hypothetical protein